MRRSTLTAWLHRILMRQREEVGVGVYNLAVAGKDRSISGLLMSAAPSSARRLPLMPSRVPNLA